MINPRRLFMFACLLSFSSLGLIAQISGGLKGRVTDASGAAVSGARIDLIQSSTNVTQTTSSTAEAYYSFPQLTPGVYQLEVIASGFQHLTRKGVTVVTGTTVTADLTVSVGGDQQVITVTSDAPLLQTETSTIQTTIPGHTIQALPLNT